MPCREGPGCAGGQQLSGRQQGVPGQPRGQKLCPGVHQTASPAGQKGGSSAVLSVGVASPGVLGAVQSLTI